VYTPGLAGGLPGRSPSGYGHDEMSIERGRRSDAQTLATYTTLLDKWIVPYLGRKRLREITRETIDNYAAQLRFDGAGAPTINHARSPARCLPPSRRMATPRLEPCRRRASHRTQSAETIDARTPEDVEAIRLQLDPQAAALVSVLAYEGLRPAEADALVWNDVLDDRGRPRERLRVQRAISGDEVTTTKSKRGARRSY
jgi:integrase